MNRCILFILLLLPVGVFAQQIKGVVVSKDGPLPSANIMADGRGTQTDLAGTFTLTLTQTGKTHIIIRYVGYVTRELDVEMKHGLQDLGTITMEAVSGSLGEVVVKGASAGSQLRAISIKKNAPGIMEVLAADAIGKLPDRNAAEAVQRIQGVSIERDLGEGRYVSVRGTPMQWSASLLNGNRLPSASADYTDRRVQMDIFPSELIEYVQLSKAITPDMEGDAIGGSVNFITRKAPRSRILNINAAGGYNDQARKGSYNTSFIYGDRLLKNKLGFIVSAVIWDRYSAQDRYNADYNFASMDPTQSFSIADLQLRDYIARRKTIGLNGGLEYVISPKHKIFASGFYSEYVDGQQVRETYFNFDAKNAQVQTRGVDYLTKLQSIELGGQSTLSSRLGLDWAISTDESSFRFKGAGYPIATFQQAVAYDGLSRDGKKYLRMDAPDGAGDAIDAILPRLSAATPLDANQMRLARVTLVRSRNAEKNKRVAFNLKYAATEKLKLKFGGKVIFKDKSVDNGPMDVYMAGLMGQPGPAVNSLETSRFPYNGGFLTETGSIYDNVIIDQISMNQVKQISNPAFISQYKLRAVVQDSATNASGATKYYTGTEDVYALYAMGEYQPFEKLTLIGGFRNEYNKVRFRGNKLTTGSGSPKIESLEQDNSYNAFLPMLHLKYNITDNDVVRLAYTRTFARADFSQLNPATTQDDVNRVITRGKADLKPTFASNFDLMAEHYFGGIGMVSVGAFYKKLSNLIYNNQSSETINGLVYTITEPDNLQHAWLAGFEAGFSKRFTALPGLLKGFGIEGNYTFTNSKVKIPRFVNNERIDEESVIPKQAKHIFNAAVVYEYGKFAARVAGNYKGKYLDVIRQAAGPDHYRWYAQNFTIDFSTSYTIAKGIRLFAEINNLTNEPVRYYHGTYNRAEQAEWYSIRGQIGVSAKIF
ncbi:MAG TPA: TonB-dependent receptor [Chitinophaga sp.]|uniref:TonB-dependent receptor n=1 Tax=Chitinophaga sp. TaxID=1869181 RepID=UPI002C9E9F00|nr:TonB-dependent receptor [Chitinophaga sp.]HVI47895.1 TonB-dependent receptor [Chitinophaga sp.]